MINQQSSWIEKTITVITCIVFSIGLLSFALIGTTSRYIQDDYCYSSRLRGDNFFLSQYNSYLYQTAYSANRFSLTLGMGLSELAGPWSVPVLPGFMLFAWLLGLYALIRRLSDHTQLVRLSRLDAFIISAALILFTLSIAPNWIQSFFWRAGMFPYFAPLVTGTYLLLLMLIAGQAAKWQPLLLLGVFLLAVLTGGFSETAVSVEIILLGIIFGLTFLKKSNLRGMILPAGIAFLGAAVALVLLIASPTNAERLRMAYGTAASLQSTIINSLDGGLYFYIAIAYRPTLFYASALVFFSLFGFIKAASLENPLLSWKQLLLALLASTLTAYLLTVAAMAPSFWAESSYPGKRALIIPGFISIVLAASIGCLSGIFLSRWRNERWFVFAAAVAGAGIVGINALWLAGMTEHFIPPAYPDMRSLLRPNIALASILVVLCVVFFSLIFTKLKLQAATALLMLIYLVQPGLMSARILDEYPILQQRAVLWDWRQVQIIAARDKGERELSVRALDSLAGLTDLSDNPGYWVNNCVADYYGLDWIRGIEPVLDPIRVVNP